VYKNYGMTCEEKSLNTIYQEYEPVTGWEPVGDGSSRVVIDIPNYFHTSRPRFWYMVLVNCEGGFQDISYNVHFVNLLASNWDKEFGVNEQGLNTLYLICFILYTFGVLVHLYGVRKLSKDSGAFVHPLVKIFTFSLMFQYLSVFSELIHLAVFVGDGWGVPALSKFSVVMETLARISFMFLLILLAKGWTITTDEINPRWRWTVTIAIFLLTVAYFSLVISQYVAVDPASNLYAYSSVPGILIIVLNGLVGFWFFVQIFITYKQEDDPHKKGFFLKLMLLYTLWFAGLPVIAGLGIELPPWWCEKVVTSFSLSATTVAYAVLGYLLWPTRAEHYFKIKTPDVATASLSGALAQYEHL